MMAARRRQPKVSAYSMAKPIAKGTVLSDAFKRNWIIGPSIAQGGFGCIYSVRLESDKKEKYVAKIEPQENGPLFTEIHFYIRTCNQDSIDEWKTKHKLHFLGIPKYVSSGLFTPPSQTRCRFLIMDKYTGDFEGALKQKQLSPAVVVKVTSNVLDALEYMHSKDYAHADIKASNLLYADNLEEVFLVDFGLVHLFRINGVHCSSKPDPKYRHNGTLEFCSRDSHQGLAPSRRGDLEILLFNLVHWLARCQPNATQSQCFGLPWSLLISGSKIRENVPDSVKNQVAAIKQKSVENLKELTASTGFATNSDLIHFAQAIVDLRYEESPNYSSLKSHLRNLHRTLVSGSSRVQTPVSKHRSTKGVLSPSTPTEDSMMQAVTKQDVPIKRRRGQLTASKASNKKSECSGNSSFPVDFTPPQSPTSRRTPRGAAKTATATESPSRKPNLTTESPCRTTPRTAQLRPTTPTRSSPRLQSSSNTPVSYQRRPLYFRDIFTDSEDDSDSDAVKKPVLANHTRHYPEPSGRKVLSPLNPSRETSVHTNTQKMVGRRRSACCQTSPKLLALAKAEALGRRAAELANEHIR